MSLRSILVTAGDEERRESHAPRAARERTPPSHDHGRERHSRRDARSILVVALAEIGDAVLLSPFLRELRRLAPRAHITLVHRPVASSLYARCPFVNRTVTYEPRVARVLRPLVLPFRSRRFVRQLLDGPAFDVAIVPRWDTDHYFATAIAFWSGAARRVGYSGARERSQGEAERGIRRTAHRRGAQRHGAARSRTAPRTAPVHGCHPFGGPLELWLDEATSGTSMSSCPGAESVMEHRASQC
jgi:hypothetical protein